MGEMPEFPGAGPELDETIRPYDFRRPGKFSKEHLRTLQMVHENFARLITSYFLGTLRTIVRTQDVQVEQTTYSEFIQSLPDPTVLAVFNLAPLPGISLLEVSSPLAHEIIHRLFGGVGPGTSSHRSLTEIELAVIQRVLMGCLGVLAESWSNLHAVTPALQRIETNPMFINISTLSEVAVAIRINADLGEQTGHISLCVPFVTLEPILVQLSASRWFGMAGPGVHEGQAERLERRIHGVEVPIVARLAQTRLTAREVLELAVGDVVLLDGPSLGDVTVFIGDRPKFTGRPGTHRGRLAVELTNLLREVDNDA